jgi:hypothetical protein
MVFLRHKVRGTQVTGASPISLEDSDRPHTNEDTIEILVARDVVRILEVVERRWEGMQRCRI